jgi:hypothetical protein
VHNNLVVTRAIPSAFLVVSATLLAAGCGPDGGTCALERCEPWTCGDPRPACPCSDLCERPECGAVVVFARDPADGVCEELASPCDVPDGWDYFFDSAECDAGQAMCRADADCGDGERCDIRSCAADATGACAPVTEVCPEAGAPVIDCAGVVYTNDCERLAAGVRYAGEAEVELGCPPGGVWARDPESGACGYYASTCYVPAGWEYFLSRDACAGPECSEEPVTAIDPETGECVVYDSDCDVPPGVEFFYGEGVCPATVGGSCGAGSDACPDGEVCDVQGCGADAPGQCVLRPAGCDGVETTEVAVCGCDGVTYVSDCERLLIGAALASRGACVMAS